MKKESTSEKNRLFSNRFVLSPSRKVMQEQLLGVEWHSLQERVQVKGKAESYREIGIGCGVEGD